MSKDFIDLRQDTWAASDDLNRQLPLNVEVNKKDRKVGIFYFMWHRGKGELMDHSLAYAMGGIEEFEKVMQQGRLGFAHYWAEPYFGYYRSDDEWVIRKHIYQLANAGIDFIFFDVTNGIIYPEILTVILKVWIEVRNEGYKTPEIMFNAGDSVDNAAKSFVGLYEQFFTNEQYKDLWLEWENKPLFLGPKGLVDALPQEIKEQFTFRKCWANTNDAWYSDTDGKGAWAWADMYPQKPGKSNEGDIEQMIVMCGFWVNGSYGTNAGRSYHNGKQPPNKKERDYGFSLVDDTSPHGCAFQEQFDLAKEIDPPIVMITGWNEWWAGRWDNYLPGGVNPARGQTIANTYIVDPADPLKRNYFVDCLNGEYSRDIEPVKGLYNDNYYYQMVSNIRQYKGTRPVPSAIGQKTIDINGCPCQWEDVGPDYLDYKGDTVKRDAVSYVGEFHYTNDTGRNDFVKMKVSSDEEFLYFYAECANDITKPESTNWMNLFINSDCKYDNGWYGYNYIINRYQNGNAASIERFADGTWATEKVGDAEFSVNGKIMQIKVSKSLLNIKDEFHFKWADNSVNDGNIMEFIDKGDVAPNDRFNYIYKK
ncbi:MAG: hypothetical protein IKY41_01350 [Clostridia bacterium]|nr:hypothetical protein [Clostridia bacterium]